MTPRKQKQIMNYAKSLGITVKPGCNIGPSAQDEYAAKFHSKPKHIVTTAIMFVCVIVIFTLNWLLFL